MTVPRSFDSQITGLGEVEGLAVDASDDLWIADREGEVNPPNQRCAEVYEYSTAQERLATQKGAGMFSCRYGVDSVAVDDSTGNVYVADSSAPKGISTIHAVDVFDAAGNFLEQWEIEGGGTEYVAVDNSGGPSNGTVYVVSNSGSLLAFNSSGNPSNFTASASYISGNKITGTPSGNFGTRRYLSVDNDGNIYVTDSGKRIVDEFKSDGEFVQAFTGSGTPNSTCFTPYGAAVDPTTGNLLVANRCRGYLEEYDPSGNYLAEITGTGPAEETPIGTVQGAVVVDSTGYVYLAANGGEVVDVFTPTIAQPKVAYGAVSNATHTSVTLNATVEPNGGGEVLSCTFEFGPTTAYGETKPCSAAPPYSGPTDVSAGFSGLTAEHKYHYRIVAANADGTRKSPDRTFTPSAVYDLTTESPSDIVPGSARLTASYTAEGHDTKYYFEYVDFEHYKPTAGDPYEAGAKTSAPPGEDAGATSGSQQLSAVVAGLEPYIVYHYRIVATNSFGTTYGVDEEFFSAPPNMPLIDATFSSAVSQTEATLNAQVNPGLGPTIVRFEYGRTPEYGSRTLPTELIGSDGADHLVAVPVANLEPGTTYHFRARATNFRGTTVGPDETFTTPTPFQPAAPTALTPRTPTAPASAAPRPTARRCGGLAKRTKRLSRQAKKLRRRASHANGARAKTLRSRARKLAANAKRLGKSLRKCRQSTRGRRR